MHVLTALDRRQIAELRERGEFFWLDLTSPGDADVELLGEIFGHSPAGHRTRVNDSNADLFQQEAVFVP